MILFPNYICDEYNFNMTWTIRGVYGVKMELLNYHKRFNPIEQLKDNVYYFVVVDIVP